MDTGTDLQTAASRLAGHPVVVGSRQLQKALQSGRAEFVCLAQDADAHVTKPLEALCLHMQVDYCWVPEKAALGQICHIEVGTAAAAALRKDDSFGQRPSE